jgi:hypothetical protein
MHRNGQAIVCHPCLFLESIHFHRNRTFLKIGAHHQEDLKWQPYPTQIPAHTLGLIFTALGLPLVSFLAP